ncbi:hypothetical protein S7711_03365 [Stachybotrys chartarum IBT 7711]|uniref:Ketopantoate reductase N-terminal domain-containing protein n=1 Tax=Stachybotrys chartarum (strain CBS 109288 / IBT 7711) TaxID=1280523 RepID=A0A084AUU0_STACB|nr:hypothetical protein S7711_03365 [Stachybotrys chartarum IBT 7711]KFA52742.1 hypothetical protein S40293_00908 [Stachybotrys chartarum IBT 40293]
MASRYTLCRLATTAATRRTVKSMASNCQSWLDAILKDKGQPPKLFAWNPSNLGLTRGSHEHEPRNDLQLHRRVYILGLGNLGRLFANQLCTSADAPPITLVVHRKELLSSWTQSDGIEILRSGVLEKNKNFDIEWWTDDPPTHGSIREVADGGKLGNIIITTKASAAMPMVDRLRAYLDRTSTVVFTQNGMCRLWPPQGDDYISNRYSAGNAPNFLGCVTTHGVTSQGLFRSLHASQADVSVGPVYMNPTSANSSGYVVQAISSAPHLNGTWVSRADLWALQLDKLVVNSIINPLTAILRCKNGYLFSENAVIIKQVMDRLLKEASDVLQALVSHPSSSDILRPQTDMNSARADETGIDLSRISRDALMARFTADQLRTMLYAVGHKVADNVSSMLQDVLANKSTEIRDFNGWIVDTAGSIGHDLDVSTHRKLIELVEQDASMDMTKLGRQLLA